MCITDLKIETNIYNNKFIYKFLSLLDEQDCYYYLPASDDIKDWYNRVDRNGHCHSNTVYCQNPHQKGTIEFTYNDIWIIKSYKGSIINKFTRNTEMGKLLVYITTRRINDYSYEGNY